MKIALSAESTIDMPKTLLEKYNINTIPFGVMLGNEEKNDGEIDVQNIVEFVKQNKVLPKTNAVNEYQYENHFNKLLETHDVVIHICLSSFISSACSNAQNVASRIKNVYIIDSRSLSTGIGLLAIYASKLIAKNYEPAKIVQLVENRIPFVQASFTLERLDYLYKGGRCNSLQLLGANLLHLRPQIIVRDGKMVSGKKYRGKINQVFIEYAKDILNTFNNPDKEEVFLTYTTADPEVVSDIKEFLTQSGFKNIHVTNAGATITSHCGEHCLGVLFINDGGVK